MLGRPVMCFLPNEEKHEARHYAMTASLVHLLELYHMPGIVIADGGEQSIDKTRELMARVGDGTIAETLREAARYFVEPFDEPYGERLTGFLEQTVAEYGVVNDEFSYCREPISPQQRPTPRRVDLT